MRTADLIKGKRRAYMSGLITHDQYYLWLCELLGVARWSIVQAIGRQRILRSTDPHMNDIPLRLWDGLHDVWFGGLAHVPAGLGDIHWSLSDTVCCAKAAAKSWRAEQVQS